jgi:hypothetical protein
MLFIAKKSTFDKTVWISIFKDIKTKSIDNGGTAATDRSYLTGRTG